MIRALSFLAIALLLAPFAAAQTTAPSLAAVVQIEGRIDDYTRDQLFKHFAQARAAGASTIIVELDTYGGLVTSALDISRFLKNQSDLHTIAYVNNKAISAGAMIAIACDEIVMADSAVIGDCAPIAISGSGGMEPMPAAERAKAESPILADFYDSAIRNHHDPQLTAAMVAVGRVVYWIEDEAGERKFVDAVAYKDLSTKGWKSVEGEPSPLDRDDTLLTVHTDSAVKLGLAKAKASTANALAADRGLTISATFAPSAGDKFVGILGGSLVRLLLLIIFLQSTYLALATPGHGAPEAVALTSIALLLGVPMLTGYAQWWEVLMIFAGLALVIFEIFVIPGHFVAGVIGVLMMIAGLVLTFVGKEPGGSPLPALTATWTAMKQGLFVVTGGLACSLFLWFWLNRYLPKLPYFNRLILTTTNGDVATMSPTSTGSTGPAVGDMGIAITDLKPGGSVRFITDGYPDGRLAAVVSDTGFVRAGTSVIVREVAGNRIVVRAAAVEASA